jgi:cytochrome c
MDSWEWNKIAGAVLGTLLFVLVLKIAIGALFEVPAPAKPGYIVPGVAVETASSGASAAPATEALPDWGTVLKTASVSDGEKISARCQQCHDLSKGGPNKIGPNLWGIVGRARASLASFSYSSAMMSNHDVWDYNKLFVYLKLPAAMVPGTKMTFAGLPSATDRINLISYLRTLSDSPMAIPAPAPAAPAAASGAATTVAAKTAAASSPAPTTTPTAAAAPPADTPDIAHADVAHGKDISARCQMCHDLSKGGPDKIGPNLWGIVNRPRASRASFNYSTAMASNHEPWTYEKLFVYLKLPAAMVPGTKMTFAGLTSAKDRTDLIGYLRTLSDSPAPLPGK